MPLILYPSTISKMAKVELSTDTKEIKRSNFLGTILRISKTTHQLSAGNYKDEKLIRCSVREYTQ